MSFHIEKNVVAMTRNSLVVASLTEMMDKCRWFGRVHTESVPWKLPRKSRLELGPRVRARYEFGDVSA
jgi:hypothetical protein